MIPRYLIWQHRWTGLLMTLFLVIVGLTGSIGKHLTAKEANQ
jgi:uncharacterized iron-regulated membrane protein